MRRSERGLLYMLQADRRVRMAACEVAGGRFDLVIYFVGEGRGRDG